MTSTSPTTASRSRPARTIDLPLGIGYLFKPYQKPRPEIVGTVVAPFSPGVVHMGRRDFHPLSANFLLSAHLKSHWTNYCKGKAEAGVEPKVADWRVARTICVADDDKIAARYGRDDENSPYRFYWHQMYSKMKRGKRLYVFKSHKDQPDEEITLDYVLDHCMIHGSVNKIVDRILALREEIGDFGEMVYAGMDWVDPALEKRSMTLMAEQVMPRVNAAIGKSAAADPPLKGGSSSRARTSWQRPDLSGRRWQPLRLCSERSIARTGIHEHRRGPNPSSRSAT